jgi:CBS domain-containing protein
MAEHAVRRIVVVDHRAAPVGILTTDDLALHARGLAADVLERARIPQAPPPRRGWLHID